MAAMDGTMLILSELEALIARWPSEVTTTSVDKGRNLFRGPSLSRPPRS